MKKSFAISCPIFCASWAKASRKPGILIGTIESAVEHGEQRRDSGWSLTALVRDYQLLQLVILEYLEESLERPLSCREAMAVGVFINDAIAASINRYVASRDEHIRRIADERTAALEEASRRKDEFIAMLAHELRNPLAPIVNSVELLQVHLAGRTPMFFKLLKSSRGNRG